MKEIVDIIFFCGQSNMQGQAEKMTENNVVIENALEYRFLTNDFVPLKNPVGENISPNGTKGCLEGTHLDRMKNNALLAAHEGKTSLVPKFCEAYTRKRKTKVIAVHCAKGDTRIEFWLPRTNCFDMTVKKGKCALEKVAKKYEIGKRYLVWLQGESNQIFATSRQAYKALLKEIEIGLKQALGIEKFAIIKVGNFTGDERGEEIITAQEEICLEDSEFYMLTEIVPDLLRNERYLNPEAEGHLNSDGLEFLGTVAGAALATFANTEENKEK